MLIFNIDLKIPLKFLPEHINNETKKFLAEKSKESQNLSQLLDKLKPLLYDLLKRKKRFDGVIKYLNNYRDPNIDIKDLLIYLLEESSDLNNLRLGVLISKLNYPLPFFYRKRLDKVAANFQVVYELLLDNEQSLITSLGFENSIGKTHLIGKLFSLDDEIIISREGYTHAGSIDLYTPTNENNLQHFIADVQGFVNDVYFLGMIKCLMCYSAMIVLHVYLDDFD